MDWLDIYSLGNSTRLIRKFLIDIASMETDISFTGLYITRKLESFENAIEVMDAFPETFSSIKRNIAHIDKETYLTLEHLEKDALLIEQISLINLKLQMSRPPTPTSFLKGLAKSVMYVRIFSTIETKRLFGEESISIERTIVNCDKLISTLKIAEEIVRHKATLDNDVFKPSRVKESVVIEMIDSAAQQVENSRSLNYETRVLINEYLAEIKAEAQSKAPKWQNIIGSLMIVAAMTSSLADAPGAAQTLQALIRYIVGTSVMKPEPPYLPAPTDQKTEGLDFFSGIQT
ncbi:hypothetical protein [Pseudomonas sp. R5(2019)]|uniref:hypothetical protein n=1 Tax=Pseudomonas sp. R5(2019) TaxID=2697566 RepID=UPI00141228FC|nr:hypothetical protein [Pseudomonas sp. R5(2019)]NBA95645.1 hypothetical protein [Pseudomonas sp. R5(2019)]